MIVKKKHGKVKMKVTKWVNKGYSPDHEIIINLNDFRDVALMLHDLKDLYNVNIDRAISEYQKGRTKLWPF